MATIPSGQKFHTVPSSVQTVERGSALANSQREIYTMQDIVDTARPYKVFTALLTQIGGDDPQDFSSGNVPLTIGKTYTITGNDSNTADFTNIGAPNNEVDTSFIATGSYPNNWGINDNAGLASNGGAPVATVLENTIGNIWISYESQGSYRIFSDGAFTENKTFITTPSQFTYLNLNGSGIGAQVSSANTINIYSIDDNSNANGILNGTPIEIRVYN